MCGRKSKWFLVLWLAFSSGFAVLSWGQSVVVPQATWDQIVSKVDTLEKILADLKNEQTVLVEKYETQLNAKDALLIKERRWSEILNDSLNRSQKTNRVLGTVVVIESTLVVLGLVVGGALWLF